MALKNAFNWLTITIVFANLVLWDVIVKQREISVSIDLAKMEVFAQIVKMVMLVSAHLATVALTVSFWAAVVKTNPVFMVVPALIMDLTLNVFVQLVQLVKLVSKILEMSAPTTHANMATAVIALVTLTALVNQNGEEKIVKYQTKHHQEELIYQMGFTRLSTIKKQFKDAFQIDAMRRKEITGVMKSAILTSVIMMVVIVVLDSILGSSAMLQLDKERTVGMFSRIKYVMKPAIQRSVFLMVMIVKQLGFLATNIMMHIAVIIMVMDIVMKDATMLHVAGMDLTVNHQLKSTK
jgi:hypothetical protein